MTISGETEGNNLTFNQQILSLLRDILNKLNDIQEELVNKPTIIINDDENQYLDSPFETQSQ